MQTEQTIEQVSILSDSDFSLKPNRIVKRSTRNARYASQRTQHSEQHSFISQTKEQVGRTDPRLNQVNTAAVQNFRLNEMRQLMKDKIESRRSMQGSVLQRNSIISQRSQEQEKIRKSTVSLPPIRKQKGYEDLQIQTNDFNSSKEKLLAQFREEFNKPSPFFRPTNKNFEVPLLTDHIGPCPPHSVNIVHKTMQKQKSQQKGLSNSSTSSPILKKASLRPSGITQSTKITSLAQLPSSMKQETSVCSNVSLQIQPRQIIERKLGSSLKNNKSLKPKKSQVNFDVYGARLNATQEDQVEAIVSHFRRRMKDGTYQILAGPPKKREQFQKVAKNSEKLLSDSLQKHTSQLKDLMSLRELNKSKKKSKIYLGSFSETTIDHYSKLENLVQVLEKNRARSPSQSDHGKPVDYQIKELTSQIKKLLKKISKQGPEISDKLKSFLSISQMMSTEYPTHLPDIHLEVSQVIEDYPKESQQSVYESEVDQQKRDKANFFKPYENSQQVSLPEQARIQNGRLEIFRYELGDGLIQALSQSIIEEDKKQKAVQELTLDQNALTDESLGRLLEALYKQGRRFRQTCATVNISNNDFGKKSVEILIKLLEFQSPDHLQNLRLSRIRIPDSALANLMTKVSISHHIVRLRLSGIALNQKHTVNMLLKFLELNDVLQELDLSYANLQTVQLAQIFTFLAGCTNLGFLSIAYNTNEFSRFPDQAETFLSAMYNFLESNNKLIHLDLSGCNLGNHVVRIGEALATSSTLQSIHLDSNQIPTEAKQALFDRLRIRLAVRKTKAEIEQEMQERGDQFEEDASPRRLMANSAAVKQVDLESCEQKLLELKRKQLKIECTQFQGVGRRVKVQEKLVLVRYLGHQELNLFFKCNVVGWQVSPTGQCYICEGWKYTIFFYDRRYHIKNKLYYNCTREVMELVNKHMGTDYKRRVAPTISSPTLISQQGSIQMGNLLEYASRLNRRISQILEQTAVNAAKKGNEMEQMIKFYLQNKVNVADAINLNLDIDLNDSIVRSLHYPDDTEIINPPQKSSYFSREMEDDHTFIWAGFAKPGKHTVLIQDPLNLDGLVKETFLVGVRENEIRRSYAPQIENIKEIQSQGASRMDNSILFSNWKKDTHALYDSCFNFDIDQIEIQSLTNSPQELLDCQYTIKSFYSHFVKMFAIFSSHSANFPLIDAARFEFFVHIFKMTSSTFSLNECFEIFNEENGGRDLNRPQFLRVILRLIHGLYLQPKSQDKLKQLSKRLSGSSFALPINVIPSEVLIKDINRGVQHFFEQKVIKFTANRIWQEFREHYVQKAKVSQILINNMTILRRVYSSWSEIYKSKRLFSIKRACDLFRLCTIMTKKHPHKRIMVISDSALRTCWGLSKFTVRDLVNDVNKYQHMVFVEFLEFVCRVAHVATFPKAEKEKDTSKIKRTIQKREEVSSDIDDHDLFGDASSIGSDRDVKEMKHKQDEEDEFYNFKFSEEHYHELTNFQMLFSASAFNVRSYEFRRKLRWLLTLMPPLLKKQEKYLKREAASALKQDNML